MANAATQEVLIDAPLERFWKIVTDYARYPEFVPGLHGCRVVKDASDEKHVEYELDLGIRKIRYVLRHVEDPPRKLSWSLVGGDLMKVSNGSWELSAEGDRTRARYSVEIQVSKPPFVPQAVIDRVSDQLSRVSLPRNLQAFKARAEAKPR